MLTHDVKTIPGFVNQRLYAALPVPGVVAIHKDTPIGKAIDDLVILIGAGVPADFENQVRFVPAF